MAKVRKSMGERNLRWAQVTQKSADLVTEMPELREPVEELRELSQEVRALEAKQSHHLSEARALTARIRALAKRADHLRGRVGASLRGKHGFDSAVLIRYGFKPRDWVKKDRADRALEKEREARAAAGEAAPPAPDPILEKE
jgi:hypothetical protein